MERKGYLNIFEKRDCVFVDDVDFNYSIVLSSGTHLLDENRRPFELYCREGKWYSSIDEADEIQGKCVWYTPEHTAK